MEVGGYHLQLIGGKFEQCSGEIERVYYGIGEGVVKLSLEEGEVKRCVMPNNREVPYEGNDAILQTDKKWPIFDHVIRYA